jgi:transposase InsO family protein
LMALFVANYRVYGARKLWIAARRGGHEIGRDQVARLMKALDIEGVTRRRKRVWTTVRDDAAARSPDLVKRNFTADAPNDLWVTDLVGARYSAVGADQARSAAILKRRVSHLVPLLGDTRSPGRALRPLERS